MFFGIGGLAAHQFVEIALLAFGGLFLIHEGESLLVEFFEKFVPRNFFQLGGTAIARKVDPEDTGIVPTASSFDMRGFTTSRFRPFADLFVVGCRLRKIRHSASLVPGGNWSSKLHQAKTNVRLFLAQAGADT